MFDYPFTEAELIAANEEWGCSCGPASLAFALQKNIRDVRYTIPGFEEKRYTSPTMMKAALGNFDQPFFPAVPEVENLFNHGEKPSLVRVQWTGPWTQPGANPKWAYRQTHWICCYRINLPDAQAMGLPSLTPGMVFDCNGGCMRFTAWEKDIVPVLTAATPRADGGWFPTHIWRLAP